MNPILPKEPRLRLDPAEYDQLRHQVLTTGWLGVPILRDSIESRSTSLVTMTEFLKSLVLVLLFFNTSMRRHYISRFAPAYGPKLSASRSQQDGKKHNMGLRLQDYQPLLNKTWGVSCQRASRRSGDVAASIIQNSRRQGMSPKKPHVSNGLHARLQPRP